MVGYPRRAARIRSMIGEPVDPLLDGRNYMHPQDCVLGQLAANLAPTRGPLRTEQRSIQKPV